MFHVEHMALKLAQILILIQFLIACEKPAADPHLGDFIYVDLNSQLQLTASKIASQEKALTSLEKDLLDARPQTGRYLILKGKVGEAKDALYRMRQQERYWGLRINERERVMKVRSLESFYRKTVPITESEEKQYRIEKRLRVSKLKWDVEERIKREEVTRDPSSASE